MWTVKFEIFISGVNVASLYRNKFKNKLNGTVFIIINIIIIIYYPSDVTTS